MTTEAQLREAIKRLLKAHRITVQAPPKTITDAESQIAEIQAAVKFAEEALSHPTAAEQPECSGPLCGLPEFGGNHHPLCKHATSHQQPQAPEQGAPKRIWLQIDPDGGASTEWPENSNDVTWCSTSHGGAEDEYVRADVAATPPAPKLEPITDEPTYLCVAWGESDLTCASIVKGLDGVKQFLVSQWLGSADHECDNGTNTLAAAMADMQDRWRIEGAGWRWSAEFEIGGVSVQLVEAVDATAHHGISTKGAV